MDSTFISKHILPNKLRLVMSPRTGDEPDPPQIDFSSTGQGLIDMTNIDLKFPSEHTVCGRRFDGEMQYYAYNPGRSRFLAVSFLLEGKKNLRSSNTFHISHQIKLISSTHTINKAKESNPQNEQLQQIIDSFILVYKDDEKKCKERQSLMSPSNSSALGIEEGTPSLASSFLAARKNSSAASFGGGGSSSKLRDKDVHDSNNVPSSLNEGKRNCDTPSNSATNLDDGLNLQGSKLRKRRLALKWHPFHPEIQKTIHFW